MHALDWPPFDEDKCMQQSIHLDFLYDSLMFVVEKGFCWEKAANVVLFADRILNQIKSKYYKYMASAMQILIFRHVLRATDKV